MRHTLRSFVVGATLSSTLGASAVAQESQPTSPALKRSAFGIALLGLAPHGEFADNVDFAAGVGGHYLFGLDPDGVAALRLDLGYLVYGHERYRAPLGSGPLGLISVDVSTTNSIVLGGLGLQLMSPGGTVRPYANASAGFSYFFTGSSVEGSNDDEPFAHSTNYHDGGFAWSAGGGLYIPLSVKRRVVSLDLGARWLDNGKRDYLRDNGITFDNNDVQLHPVRTEAKGLQFNLGVTISFR